MRFLIFYRVFITLSPNPEGACVIRVGRHTGSQMEQCQQVLTDITNDIIEILKSHFTEPEIDSILTKNLKVIASKAIKQALKANQSVGPWFKGPLYINILTQVFDILTQVIL